MSKVSNLVKPWGLPCGCKGREDMCQGALVISRWYCKEHEAQYNLEYRGRRYAIDKEGKEYDPADHA